GAAHPQAGRPGDDQREGQEAVNGVLPWPESEIGRGRVAADCGVPLQFGESGSYNTAWMAFLTSTAAYPPFGSGSRWKSGDAAPSPWAARCSKIAGASVWNRSSRCIV